MHDVEGAIRQHLSPGQQLFTDAGRKPFLVGEINGGRPLRIKLTGPA